ncbi:MAG TPA: GNAT family protein [Solirubrobacteraceae bacterium]
MAADRKPRARPRVELRTPTPADRDRYIAAMRASRALYRGFVSPWTTPDAFDGLVRRAQDDSFEPMLACRRDDGAIVGFVNISQIVRGRLQSGFMGYGGVAGQTGQGYMTEAIGLALRRAFTELRLHRIEANIQPSNTASIALVRRCGFELEGFSPRYLKVGGRWRDHERWAIRAEQWRALRSP